jgi:RND family efflux transporter MFP subunit
VTAAAAEVALAPPRVTVAVAKPRPPAAERVLPGNATALMEAALFARTTGYLSKRLVDIGDRVHQGQLLAVITAPDIDDQLAQARANLAQAQANLPLTQANLDLAKITLRRDLESGPGSAFSLQQIDQDKATVKTSAAQVEVTRASIQVNDAAVRRFADLQSFQRITAPFPGVITARNVEVGDLIPADTPSTTREMFHVMRTDILRVFVDVPQVFATGIKVGQRAAVYRQDQPQTQYPGKVTRTANALDPSARTLLTEVDVPNPNDSLRPGMYLQVKFVFDRVVTSVMIPTAALATRTGGPRVGVLDGQHRVHYRTVHLGRDYGAEVEVITGLKAGDTIVVHPGDDLSEGTVVEPVALPAT